MTVSFLPPPVPVRASMTALQQAMAGVLAEPADDPRAAAEVDALLVLRAQLDAVLLSRLGDVDRSGTWSLDGSVTQAAWLRNRGNLGRHDASRSTTPARRLSEHPHVRAALRAGRITEEHASVVCTALRQIDGELWEEQEPLFVRAAELTDPVTLATELRKRTAALAPLPAERGAERRRDQRRFGLRETLDGMWHLSGLLDPESGTLLQTAITSQRRTDHTDGDTRTPAQRDADALVHLARLACERGELPSTHRVRPHLLVLTPSDQLAGRCDAELATLSGGEPLTPSALQRLACDAILTRIVLDPAGLPLDVGRAQRTVPPQIWLAALLRDGGCSAQGCRQPAERCEAHHIKPFSHGGDTSLANTALLCLGANGHHHQVHDQQRVIRLEDGRRVGPRGYVDLPPHPWD